MRFSVLTLNLHTWQETDQLEKLDRVARFAAEENISALCLQECGQRRDAPYYDEASGLRSDNTARLIQARLEEYGLKYGLAWAFSHNSFEHYEEGSAVLTQLPILGSCSRFVSCGHDPDSVQSRNVIMARLAVAPTAVIDLYSVHLSPPEDGLAEQLDALAGFVSQTPEVLEQMKPPPPKRRGPPRKRVASEEPRVTTRLICLAGDLNDEPHGLPATLSTRGYLEASALARESRAETGTFQDGRWIDYIFIRPALRPQSARLVFTGAERKPVSDHYAVSAEFEV
ncbi:MAG: endonuclease/exonuclease/phosphatase family protein [Spirochaetota bacterium]